MKRSVSLNDSILLILDVVIVVFGALSWIGAVVPKNAGLGLGAVLVGIVFLVGQIQRMRKTAAR